MEEKHCGYLLSHRILSDSRIILSLFSREGGRQQGVIRLGRKSSRAFLTPLSQVSYHLSGRQFQSLPYVKDIQLERHCFDLGSHYGGLLLLSYWCHLLETTQPEGQADEHVYRLVDHVQESLSGQNFQARPLFLKNLYFEMWLLHFCGVLPRQAADKGEALAPEAKLHSKLPDYLVSRVFERRIEDFVGDALQWGALNQAVIALGEMWERLLDRPPHNRGQLLQQLMGRGRQT